MCLLGILSLTYQPAWRRATAKGDAIVASIPNIALIAKNNIRNVCSTDDIWHKILDCMLAEYLFGFITSKTLKTLKTLSVKTVREFNQIN